MCGVGAAVANALPSLKQHADLVLEHGHGAGVSELIDRMLDGSLETLHRRPRTPSPAKQARVRQLSDPGADVHPDS